MAVTLLREAYTKGLISYEEMDERVRQVLYAKTHGELLEALTSLPADKDGSTSTIGAVSGRIRRRGTWRVPRNLKIESAFARVHLDLSRAVIEHPEVDIELQLGTGNAKIRVPRDAIVDVDGLNTVWKDARYRPRRQSWSTGPRIRISGTMGLGRLKIRHAWR